MDFSPRTNELGFELIYYWDFNSTETTHSLIEPVSAVAYTSIFFEGNYFDAVSDGSDFNLREESESGAALRLRNPSDHLDIEFSSEGYEEILLSYALMRTNNGARKQNISYSVDGGTNFLTAGLIDAELDVSEDWQHIQINFSGVRAVNNNPQVIIRLSMAEGNSNTSGNQRMDNLAIDARPMDR